VWVQSPVQQDTGRKELSEHELLDLAIERVRRFLRENGLHLLVALVTVIAALVAARTIAARRDASKLKAWSALAADGPVSYLYRTYAMDPDWTEQRRVEMMADCREIIDEHGRSKAVPWAMLRLAALHVLGEELDDASKTYESVMKEYGGTVCADSAREGLATVLEDMGDYTRAAGLYEEIAAERGTRFLMAAARCYEMAGELESAESTYSEVVEAAQTPELPRLARQRLRALDEGKPLGPPPALRRPRPLPPPIPEGTEPGAEGAETPEHGPSETPDPAPPDTPVQETD